MTTKTEAAQPSTEELQAELTAVQERFTKAVNDALQWATANGVCSTFDTVMQHCGLPVRSGRKQTRAARFTAQIDLPVEVPEDGSRTARDAVRDLRNDPDKVRAEVVRILGEGSDGIAINYYDTVNTPVPLTYEDLIAPASNGG